MVEEVSDKASKGSVKNPTTNRAPSSRASDARYAAFSCLCSILLKHHTLQRALGEHKLLSTLDYRDRAFAHLLTNSVLRNLGVLDEVISSLLARPLTGADSSRLRILLRLGAAQLLFLNTKDYAVVSNSVAMAERIAGGRFCPLVNALLRNLARRKDSIMPSPARRWRLSTPHWLWQSWLLQYGLEVCEKIAEQHTLSPLLAVSVKDGVEGEGEDGVEAWQKKLQARVVFGNSLVLSEGARVKELPGFNDGAWWVQDPAAALPVRALGNVDGLEILDLCAAPGGKTCQLVASGARVTAVDYSDERMKILKDNLKRMRLADKTRCLLTDLEDFDEGSKYAGVLLDAPCSGTGTIRRHPDILHLKTPQEVERLHHLQCRLLLAAWRSVARGGLLVYSCCSLQREEGEAVIEACLQKLDGASIVAFTNNDVFGHENFITADGFLRTLPFFASDMGGIDGFFAAKIQRGV